MRKNPLTMPFVSRRNPGVTDVVKPRHRSPTKPATGQKKTGKKSAFCVTTQAVAAMQWTGLCRLWIQRALWEQVWLCQTVSFRRRLSSACTDLKWHLFMGARSLGATLAFSRALFRTITDYATIRHKWPSWPKDLVSQVPLNMILAHWQRFIVVQRRWTQVILGGTKCEQRATSRTGTLPHSIVRFFKTCVLMLRNNDDKTKQLFHHEKTKFGKEGVNWMEFQQATDSKEGTWHPWENEHTEPRALWMFQTLGCMVRVSLVKILVLFAFNWLEIRAKIFPLQNTLESLPNASRWSSLIKQSSVNNVEWNLSLVFPWATIYVLNESVSAPSQWKQQKKLQWS